MILASRMKEFIDNFNCAITLSSQQLSPFLPRKYLAHAHLVHSNSDERRNQLKHLHTDSLWFIVDVSGIDIVSSHAQNYDIWQ